MHFEEMLITDICKYPNTKVEIDQFVNAIDKVVLNTEELRSMLN